jgi:ADP-heptose:LPS heptosyltransferase
MSNLNLQQVAVEFMRSSLTTGDYSRQSVAALADAATSDDTDLAKEASDAIFGTIVEPLADCFEPSAVSLYNRVFSQIVQKCREVEPELDRALAGFGIATEADLLSRAEALRPSRSGGAHAELPGVLDRVILLSRVTVGADVAITSVLLGGLRRKYPDARFVLAGGSKLTELFGGDSRLSFCHLDYTRAGTLRERLLGWLQLVKLLHDLTRDTGARCLIVDPDTRLTQLGLLPVVPDDANYLFFPSREYGAASRASLAQLAADWMNEALGVPGASLPLLHLNPADRAAAAALAAPLRGSGPRPVITVNLGVGENPKKRVGDEFEQALVLHLLRAGAAVILDKGAGQEESARIDRIVRGAQEENAAGSRLNVWSGRLGLLAALISESDLYIGYDSAGQHIAAALAVPCIDIFAGYSSKRMMDRWRPTGPAEVVLIDARASAAPSDVAAEVTRHAERRARLGNIGSSRQWPQTD